MNDTLATAWNFARWYRGLPPMLSYMRLEWAFRQRFKLPFEPFKHMEYLIDSPHKLMCWIEFGHSKGLFSRWPELMPERPTILDVGANVGIFGYACRLRWPEARIVGFEPHPKWAQECRDTGAYDVVNEVAIGDVAKEADLWLDPKYQVTATTGGSGLLNWVGGEGFKVKQVRVDDLGYEPDAVKMDIDGGELRALLGGYKTIMRAKAFIVECLGKPRQIAMAEFLERKPIKLTYRDLLFL
jgi:FkbM family methyltransferase